MAFTDSNTASCTIAAYRARAKAFWLCVTAVFTAITFQSNTTSALAPADNNRAAIKVHSPRILFFVPLYILFIVLPPDSSLAFGQCGRHPCNCGRYCPYRRVCRGVMLCVALNAGGICTYDSVSGVV